MYALVINTCYSGLGRPHETKNGNRKFTRMYSWGGTVNGTVTETVAGTGTGVEAGGNQNIQI